MIQSIRRETIALGLLNTLETERYVRVPLLVEVIDTIASDARFGPALETAQALLYRLEHGRIDDADLVHGIDEIRALVVNPRAAQTVGTESAA